MPKRGKKSSLIIHLKAVWITIGFFLFYLLTLPQVVSQIIPCLRLIPGSSYSWQECHVTLALDWFISLALIGLTLSSMSVFISVNLPKLKPTLITALILSASTILAYYLYIPHAEAQVKRAPMVLEPSSFTPNP